MHLKLPLPAARRGAARRWLRRRSASADPTDTDAEHDRTVIAEAPVAVPAQPAVPGGRGSGSLRLGGEVFEFAVRACNFSIEVDDLSQTMSGRGILPTGERFDVIASRNAQSDIMVHRVSIYTGNPMFGEGRALEALRMRVGAKWGDEGPTPDEPLIQIAGYRLRAAGCFAPPDPSMPDPPADGILEAECG
jgi:hypothetical protein